MVSILDYLCVYLPVFQDVRAEERCLKNLQEYGVRKVYVIEGRAKLFEGNSFVSTDGTIEVAKSFDNVELIQSPKKTIEIRDKHNIAFKKAGKQGYEWMIIIGADEYITGDLEIGMAMATLLQAKFPSVHYFNVGFKEHNLDSKYSSNVKFLPRLLHNPGHFRAKYTHWTMFYDGVKVEPFYVIDSFTINADDTIRPKWRNEAMDRYQDKNIQVEHKNLFTAFRDPSVVTPEAYTEHECPTCGIVKRFFLGRCVGCLNEYKQ